MRGVSILMVVISHVLMSEFNSDFPGRAALGMFFHGLLGVRIFFVISGFIITYILMTEYTATGSVSLPDFYKRRFVRLLPALFAFVAGAAILSSFSKNGAMPAYCAASALTFTMAFTKSCGWDTAHLWSLTVEEIFYLAWPLMLARGLRKRSVTLPLLVVCMISNVARAANYFIARGSLPQFPLWEHASVFMYFDQIAIGAWIAYSYAADKTGFERLYRLGHGTSRALALGCILLAHLGSEAGPVSVALFPISSPLLSFGTAWLLGSLISRPEGLWHKCLAWKPLAGIGLVSYSLYLWQELFFVAGGSVSNSNLQGLARFPVNILAMSTCAWLSYRFVEKPSHRLALQWGILKARKSPPPSVPFKRAG